ncbi:MAG: 4-(cytidine 5'-diphospho)-2-C-methyl-D-erythritol kinase [Eubacteriales bacterium]|nr:4-(cytidine 5'-diphospho)-2-C-methyl-D-erythritol kinase [Eubacteriales bacterium]
MLLKCNAKINWFLDIVGKFPNGYHNLNMLMQSIDLCDVINIEKSSINELYINGVVDENLINNLCFKAVFAFQNATKIKDFFCIHLQKHIPMGAGLGGGSADAAGILKALNKMYHSPLSDDELLKIGLRIGADVPFMLQGGFAQVQGIGEIVSPINADFQQKMLLVYDGIHLSTKDVFQSFSLHEHKTENIEFVQQSLIEKKFNKLQHVRLNALYTFAEKLAPGLKNIIVDLYALGASLATMTGSGSAIIACFETDRQLNNVYEIMKKQRKQVYIVNTVAKGIHFL